MTNILIYQDYVHNNGALYRVLAERYGRDQVAFADVENIKNGALNERIKAFFMPGGASRYVYDKLGTEGNRLIRDYVAKGGCYIGLCAGAYYGCRHISWQPGDGPSYDTDQALDLFPGTAAGPVSAFVNAEPPFHMAHITTITTDGQQQFPVFYWAGPVFSEQNAGDYTVLARYDALPDRPAAVITGEFGQGRYLLASPHLEIDSEQLERMRFNVPDNRYADIADLPDRTGLSQDYFIRLLDRMIV